MGIGRREVDDSWDDSGGLKGLKGGEEEQFGN
jgi:hypothetical protein